jgi:hypothetical protein
LLAATVMKRSSLNIKTKITLHSLGVTFILSVLLLLSITLIKFSIAKYLIAGLLTGEILRIVFSKRKYLTSVQQNDYTITINYLNRMLRKKSISINKEGLNITDIKEVNWWYGNLDFINFSTGRQNVTFDYIDKNLKQTVLENLENA